MSETVHPLKLVSLLLQYPDGELLAARSDLYEAALEVGDEEIARFAAWWHAAPPGELQARYVETFDFSRRSSLHLTYHTFGDRRQRGMALLALKQRYAAAGFDVDERELPDYLPLVLEFAVLAPEAGLEVIARHRVSIELIRSSLHAAGSPWAPLLDVVARPLPGLTGVQAARIRRLAQEGPPVEEVGLEPFAPPEVMPVR